MRRLAASYLGPLAYIVAVTMIPSTAYTQTVTTLLPQKPGCIGTTLGEQSSGICRGIGAAESVIGAPTSSSRPPRSSASFSGSEKHYVPYDQLTTAPDGTPCVKTTYVEQPTTSDPGTSDLGQGLFSGPYLACPIPAGQTEESATASTPVAVSVEYWEHIPLPRPQPHIAPGRAITGLLAYLETSNEVRHIYTNSTLFGPLEIVATGRYYVDWGDGQRTGPYDAEGGPWPDGTITHQYIDVGNYDVVVTERWTAAWKLGGESGNLRQLQTVGRIDDFPVQQIQAVVYR
jgi:hypothetical protein